MKVLQAPVSAVLATSSFDRWCGLWDEWPVTSPTTALAPCDASSQAEDHLFIPVHHDLPCIYQNMPSHQPYSLWQSLFKRSMLKPHHLPQQRSIPFKYRWFMLRHLYSNFHRKWPNYAPVIPACGASAPLLDRLYVPSGANISPRLRSKILHGKKNEPYLPTGPFTTVRKWSCHWGKYHCRN